MLKQLHADVKLFHHIEIDVSDDNGIFARFSLCEDFAMGIGDESDAAEMWAEEDGTSDEDAVVHGTGPEGEFPFFIRTKPGCAGEGELGAVFSEGTN